MSNRTWFAALLCLALLLTACSASPETPTATAAPSDTPASTATATPIPTPTPEPIGGGTGMILYTRPVPQQVTLENGNSLSYSDYQLEKMDLATGKSEILITRAELEEQLGQELYQAHFNPSPDGSQVVISVATALSGDGLEDYDNYLASPDLSKLVPILDTGADFVQWIWSPDGSMLLGNASIDNSRGILLVNNDGSGLRKLIKSGLISKPVWAADSSKFYTLLLGYPVATDLEGKESQPVGFENIEDQLVRLSFSPDGQQVAYLTEPGEVYLAKSDFSEKVQVDMESTYKRCLGDYYPRFYAWSPDSTQLIFRDVNCIRNIGLLESDYLIQAPSGILNLPFTGDKSWPTFHCGWAPDGQMVLKHSDQLTIGELKLDYPEGASCPTWIQ